MTQHPYQLTVPVAMTVQPNASGTFTVVNSGSRPEVVSAVLGRYTDKTVRYPAADHATLTTMSGPWLSVTPATFVLQPGTSKTVRIASQVPGGAQGDHFLNVLWSIRPVHEQAGAVHATGGPATTVTIPLPGTATPVTSHGVAVAPKAPVRAHLPAPVLAAGIVAVALGLLAILTVISATKRRRQGRSPRPADYIC